MATVEQPMRSRASAPWPDQPPRLSVGQAVLRSWWVLAMAVLVLVGAAVAIGLSRESIYTAESRLSVGKIDVSSQQLPGYVEATKSLAAAYSRAASAETVVRQVAARTRLSPAYVADHVGATPVPDAPVLNIKAKGRPPARVVQLANATATILTSYVTSINQNSPQSQRLLARFRAATVAASRAETARDRLRRKADVGTASPGELQRLLDLRARSDSLELEKTTLSGLYQQAQQANSATASIQVLSRAGSATSDRSTFLQRLVLVAILVGAALGTGLAVLRSNVSVERLGRRRREMSY